VTGNGREQATARLVWPGPTNNKHLQGEPPSVGQQLMAGALPPFPTGPVNSEEANETRWFMEEVHAHGPALRSYLRTKFPRLADIDDLVQESFARLWRMRGRGRAGSGKGLLFATARNIAIDNFRRERAAGIDFVPDCAEFPVAEPRPGVAETVCRNQELALLEEAIAALPERCRQVLTLRKIYGLSHQEIGARLGISEHTVESQLGRGMAKCVEYLRRRGLPEIIKFSHEAKPSR